MSKVSIYTAEQIADLVDQFNQKNQLLHSTINDNKKDVLILTAILKSALGAAGTGEDADTTLAMAMTLATLSQRVALLEAKARKH